MAERGPKVSMAIKAPDMMISQGIEVRLAGDLDMGMGTS